MNTNKKQYDLVILGSGPAGCTAGIYAARANLNFTLITGNDLGGQIARTDKISNWPGFFEDINGVNLMDGMMKQMERFNGQVTYDTIVRADFSSYPFCLYSENEVYTSKAVIIATGALPRMLGIPDENRLLGRGLSTCAVCDGLLYRGQEVVIIGGGNTMAEEVLYLSKLVSKITVVHRRDKLRAESWLVKQLEHLDNLVFELDTVVEEITSDSQGVTGVKVKHLTSGETKIIPAAGVFMAIGFEPNSGLFQGQIELHDGFIKTGYLLSNQTSIAGVFAAGDVVFQSYRQAVVAAGSGCAALLDVQHFLSTLAAEEITT